ncbi:uncharacterized protein AMSG_07129 [Thecamonas trahens ATCC 50062]|uniref:Uncharacterized protein n=1 Tax=Thecamonas trahens ATCC 50062 TaxID=461836 RepID=A0A0L0DF31_THETB|nr:hypothetical protein AMSG_07129 [Thecamonas trahens ATCC 50062]KNC50894.1 hypothetical protein AMSG_07129 [Thecamonas trahens ATCC 50062]|eukprot:XP_013756600.1 hypothetical protein AMSG_07129 [Thecamonas trahens ATCC 50062]
MACLAAVGAGHLVLACLRATKGTAAVDGSGFAVSHRTWARTYTTALLDPRLARPSWHAPVAALGEWEEVSSWSGGSEASQDDDVRSRGKPPPPPIMTVVGMGLPRPVFSPWYHTWNETERELHHEPSAAVRCKLYFVVLAEQFVAAVTRWCVAAHNAWRTRNESTATPWWAVVYFPQRLLFAAASGAYLVLVITVLGIYYAIEGWKVASEMPGPWGGVSKASALALGLGAIIMFVLVILMTWLMFRRYRQLILQLRRGKYVFDPRQFALTDASYFVPYHIVHLVLGSFVLMFILTLALGIGLLTFFVPAVRSWAVTAARHLLATVVVNAVVWWLLRSVFVAVYFDDGGLIRNRRWFSLFDYLSTYLNLATGLAAAVKRLVWALVIQFAMLWRLDVPAYPRGYEAWDAGFSAFVGMLLLDHQYNSPVFVAAAEVFAAYGVMPVGGEATPLLVPVDAANCRRREPPRSRRARNRWHLAFTLVRNPELVAYRAHHLEVLRASGIDLNGKPGL